MHKTRSKASVAKPKRKSKRGRQRFRSIFRAWRKGDGKKLQSKEDGVTVFEVCDAPKRPAIATQAEYKLKWKHGAHLPLKPQKIDDEFDEIQKTKEFQIARRIMIQLRSSNILETMVSRENLPEVQKFFKEDMDNPTPKVVEIIDNAMEVCYNEVMYHQERYDFFIDADMRQFLLNKDKAKQCLLDVLLICPEFMPLMWGGESVGLPTDDEVKLPAQLGSSGEASPWQKVVKKASGEKIEKKLSKISSAEGITRSNESTHDLDRKKKSLRSDSRSDERISSDELSGDITTRKRKSSDSLDKSDERLIATKRVTAKSTEKEKSRHGVYTKRKEERMTSAPSYEGRGNAARRIKSAADKTGKTVGKLRKIESVEKVRSSKSHEKLRKSRMTTQADNKHGGSDKNVKNLVSSKKVGGSDEEIKMSSSDEKVTVGSREKIRSDGSKEGDSREKIKSDGSKEGGSLERIRFEGLNETMKSSGSTEKARSGGSNEKCTDEKVAIKKLIPAKSVDSGDKLCARTSNSVDTRKKSRQET